MLTMSTEATVKDGLIICDDCDLPARNVYFVPRIGDPDRKIVAACGGHATEHDGTYELRIYQSSDGLDRRPWHWVFHLAQKALDKDGAEHPLVQLGRWLDFAGGEAMDRNVHEAHKAAE